MGCSRLGAGQTVYALEGFPENEEQASRRLLSEYGVPVFCQFSFEFQNIPDDVQVVQVEIPEAGTGAQSYAKDELEQVEWRLKLAVGL